MIRLLVCSPFYPPRIGGLESHAAQFNDALSKHNVLITVFTPRIPTRTNVHEQVSTRITVIRFPAWEIIASYPLPKFWLPSFWSAWGRVRQGRYDIVISRTRFFLTSAFAFFFARSFSKPWVHIEHGSDYVQSASIIISLSARLIDLTLGRIVLKRADVVIANSQASAGFVQDIVHRSGVPVIYRGIEADKIAAAPSADWARQQYAGAFIITFVGRLVSGKGLFDLLTAIQQISTTHPEVVCFIIGGGSLRPALERQAHRLGIGQKVIFFGERSYADTIGLLKVSDIVVNPSHTEGLPTSVIEAALCQKAIVATDVGGTREIITNGQSGLLVAPRNVPALAGALIELISDNKKRTRLAQTAFYTVQNKFSWEKNIQSYFKIFDSLVPRNTP